MTGCESASTLAMIGSSIVSGSLPRARDDLVADVGGRGIGIALQREAHVDAARLRAALRRHQLDALDAGERILERLRHLRLDDLGRRAAIRGVDADDRLVDPRILAHRQPRVRDQADQQDDQRQHRREDGPLDADLGQLHDRALASGLLAPARRSVRELSALVARRRCGRGGRADPVAVLIVTGMPRAA